MPARGHIGPPHISRSTQSFDALRKLRDLIDLAKGRILQENQTHFIMDENKVNYILQDE